MEEITFKITRFRKTSTKFKMVLAKLLPTLKALNLWHLSHLMDLSSRLQVERSSQSKPMKGLVEADLSLIWVS